MLVRRSNPVVRLAVLGGLLVLLASLCAAAVASARDFDNPASSDTSQQFGLINPQREDTPNDPEYDFAEPDDQDSATVTPSTNVFDEQFGLFGFPSARTRASAIYSEGAHAGQPMVSGFNASGAWKLERGKPGVAVAILDTGIKWNHEELRTQVRLNPGELPKPAEVGVTTCASPASYDCNGDGAFNVEDYVGSTVDPNAGAHGVAGKIDAEDLIATFSDGTDADGNGFVDDIAGWDFFDNDNDPYDASSYFAAANHGSGRADNAAERGNDGEGGIGVCPHCQILPIRTWDTFVSDGNTFAMGMLYATDNGASVIEGANGSLYHSAFAERASQYAYDHGVVQTFSGDDLNTANHNYPANYGHAMLIQGTVPDTMGLGEDAGQRAAQELAGICKPLLPLELGCPGTNIPLLTYFRGANTTQYGGKSSISMEGATGSENTGKAAGAAALVLSAALDHAPPIALRPDETREILEQTAERVTGGATGVAGNVSGLGLPDRGASGTVAKDQWTPHFGWGRVNLGAAVSVARSGQIPPEAAIDSPDWYAPLTGPSVHIAGLARARFATAGQFHWELQWGVGEEPATWTTAHEGDSATEVSDFGDIDLGPVRGGDRLLHAAGGSRRADLLRRSRRRQPAQERVHGPARGDRAGDPDPGDRPPRSQLGRRPDPAARLPQAAGHGRRGADPLRRPQRRQRPGADRPDRGRQHPCLRAQRQRAARLARPHAGPDSGAGHAGAPGFAAVSATAPPREAPRGPVVADLDGDGRPELIDTAGTHIYAWEPDGSLRPGFPVSENLFNCRPSLESQPLSHPKCGFLSSPAVAHLEGAGKPFDIVAPSLDGHLYAFDGSGDPLPGYPVALVDPSVPAKEQMIAESINEPAIGDLNGDGVDDVVVATNETYGANPPSGEDIGGLLGQGLSDLLAGAAGGSSRVYAIDGAQRSLPPWLADQTQRRDPEHAAADRSRPEPGDRQDRRRRADRRLDHRLGGASRSMPSTAA